MEFSKKKYQSKKRNIHSQIVIKPVFRNTKNFSTIVGHLIQDMNVSPSKRQDIAERKSAPLVVLDYEQELYLKNKGFALFWREHNLPGTPELLIPSPKSRRYRTTSKRKVSFHKGNFTLSFDGDFPPGRKKKFVLSSLEPISHSEIYRFLHKKLSESSARVVASHLNYLIIRGSYTERAVIFNVDMMNGPIVRKLKAIARQLQEIPELAQAAFIYLDPSRSDYYLEGKRPDVNVPFKRLYGPSQLTVCHEKCRYRYDPTSFSQVNEAIVPILLQTVRYLLTPSSGEHLLDLYCGYGLFSHYLASDYQKVVGIDAEGPAIRSAIATCRLNAGRTKARFLAGKITGKSLKHLLPVPVAPEALLLDPPRQGPQPGVIDTLGRRNAEKVIHIFCGVDQIPTSINEWHRNGYIVAKVVPLDMFPGSANLEVIILFTPKKNMIRE